MDAIVEIVGKKLIDGVWYIIGKVVDEVGKTIWRAFTDEDGDRVPDDPANPSHEWDEDPGDWEPFDPVPDVPVVPVDPEPTKEISFVVINPDGTMTIYDEAGNITAEVVDNAYSLWLSENNFLDKNFDNYSVSEGFLFLIFFALAAIVIKFFFGRRGMF